MALPPRPLRPRGPSSVPAAPRKKPPVLLLAGIGAAAVALIAILFVALGGKPAEEERPKVVAPPTAPKEPEYAVRVHQVDGGRSRQLTILVQGPGTRKLQDFAVVDGEGKEHPAAKADDVAPWIREMQKDPTALILFFNLPMESAAYDLRVPGGKKHPVFRAPAREAFRPLPASGVREEWTLALAEKSRVESALEVEVRASPSGTPSGPFDPKELFLLADTGDVVVPEIVGRDPYRLRYLVPKSARELRLQMTFRGPSPDYLVVPWAAVEAPAVAKPDAPAPPPPPAPAGSLRAAFDAKLKDPVAALRWLAEQPPGDEARTLARTAIARTLKEDVDAGLKAFQEGKADAAERHFVRAALLADPYQPEFSRQLMRMLFLLKQPRKIPTGCATCKGAGAGPCGGCQAGLVLGHCPRCEAKGQVNCLLCDGSGRQDHHGYKGTVTLTCGRFKFPYQGKTATMDPQTITYQLSPCAGGSFHVTFESTHAETGRKTPGSKKQTCEQMWAEFRNFVFSGKAKIRVPNRKGQLVPISASSAKRFFADYESCKSGTVSCDRCEGRKQDPCSACSASGKASILCTACEGTSQKACATCKGYGDAAWLAKLLPAAPALSHALGEQAVSLRDWLDERARSAARKDDLARRLAEAKKGLDPSHKLTDDTLDIACPRCRGGGGECVECWATGRREYFAGSAPYERYALAKRLERQLADAGKPPAAPSLVAAAEAEPLGGVAVVAKPLTIPPPRPPSGAPLVVPKNIDEIVKKADQLHETGRTHLEKAKTTQDQNIWIEEAVKALDDLKNAQTLYATAQEKMDEAGLTVPRELLLKFRTNMQALVIARRTAP